MVHRTCGGGVDPTAVGGAPVPIGAVHTGGRATTDGVGIAAGGAPVLIGPAGTGARAITRGVGIAVGGDRS
jgi:hypothetical protein